jgi:hypothetical protein
MGTKAHKISIIVLSLLFATSTASATELLENGSFEAGDLAPWEKIGDPNSWTVSDEYVLEGMYSGFVVGTDQIRQSFQPRLGANIDVFSTAVMTAMAGTYVTVEIEYADALGTTPVSIRIPTAFQWHTFDLLNRIDPEREVSGLVLTGHRSGYTPYHTRTWFDAVTLQNNAPEDPIDPTDSDETELVPSDLKKLRLRLNLKKARTHVSLALRADDVPEGIHEGEATLRLLISQDGLTTEFETAAELVEVPHSKGHILRFMDVGSAEKRGPKR